MRIISANISGSLTLNGVDVTNVTVSSSIWSGSMAGRIANLEQFSSSLDATFATDAQLAAATASLSASLALPIAALNSYTASNTDNISALNAQTASLLAYTSSNDTKVTALNTFSSSILSYTSSNNANISSLNSYTSSATARFVGLETATASLNTYTSSNTANITSLNSYTSSATDRFVGLEAATSSLNSFTSSANTRLGTLEAATASLNSYTSSATARFVGLEAATASLNSYTSSNTANITSLNSYTSSATARFVGLEAATSSLNTFTSSINSRVTVVESKYATTGSNTFTGQQYSSNTTVPVGFANTTASIYTDGGLLAKRDVYFSSSLYIKGDLIVYGTQSVEYITSSNLNISDNIITVNTATPSVRFGGLAVYDSGSTGLTGSLLWDSQNNNWLYSNPTGSGNYDSSMVIMGPRNSSALGNEAGLTCNYLVQGHGSHHTTSSMIFHDGSTTCIGTGMSITSAGAACFADTVCANTFKSRNLIVCEGASNSLIASSNNEVLRIQSSCPSGMFTTYVSGSTIIGDIGNASQTFSSGNTTGFAVNARDSRTLELGTANTSRMAISATGIACFACQVCAPSFISSGTSCFSGCVNVFTGNQIRLYNSAKNNWVQIESPLVSGDAAIDFKLTTATGAVYMNSTGITCFNNTVCTPALVVSKSNPVLYINAGNNETSTIGFTQGAVSGYGGFIKVSTGLGDRAMTFGLSAAGTNNDATEVVRIDDSGVTCFSSSVCAPFFSAGDGTQCNEGDAPLTIKRGVAFAGLDFKSLRTTGNIGGARFYDCAGVVQAQQLVEVDGSFNFYNATSNNRFKIASTGIACFACQVCAPTMIVSNCINIGTTTSLGSRLSIESANDQAGITMYNSYDCNKWSLRTGTPGISNKGFAIVDDICNVTRIQIDGAGKVGIGTLSPARILTVNGGNVESRILLQNNCTGTAINNGFDIVMTTDCLAQVWNYQAGAMQFATSNNERLSISSTGVSCFACQVCAPQYITTQGSSVSYADGSNYLVWNSESEYCSLDNQTNCTLTTMKTWIADRTGCVRLKFAGYISSGPTYWGWRIYRNNSTAYTCQSYAGCLETGCSANVHGYTIFSVGIGPVNPGDCITLQMVSTGGGSTPAPGQNQYLFAKEFRIYSTTPNFSAGSPSNVFGDRLGVGISTPCQSLHLYTNLAQSSGVGSAIQFTSDGAGGDNGWIGVAKGTGNGLELSVENRDIIFNTKATTPFGGTERLRITCAGNVGIGTCAPNEKLTVWTSSTTGLQTALRLNNPFGFDNLNTGAQIVFSQDRSVAEDLKQGIIAVGQADAGTSATSFMAFYTNNTGLGERLRITSTGVACFATTVCAPSFYTSTNSYLTKAALRLRSANDAKYLDIQTTNTCNIISSNYGDSDIPIILGSYSGYQLNQLFLSTNCNVGIRTNDPKSPLDVANTHNGGAGGSILTLSSITNAAYGQCMVVQGYFSDTGNGECGILGAISIEKWRPAGQCNGGDIAFYTRTPAGSNMNNPTERARIYNNGASKFTMGGVNTAILQQSYSIGGNGCINICFDIFNIIPGKGSGWVFQADIYVGGYGSAGASGLLYRASVAGYDGHHVGIGSYHQSSEQVKCASGVDIKIYNPAGCSCLLGVTIYNCSGTYSHVGTMKMIITY
jgi:hypothetical protein